MEWMELNKIAAGLLAALLVMLGIGFISEEIFHPSHEQLALYGIVEAEPAKEASAAAAPAEVPLPVLLASASVSKGASAVGACKACHNFEDGGANGIGPNLYDIVGEKVADVAGYDFSSALKSYGGTWTFERLNTFIDNPQKTVPGTKMSFAGIKNDQKRADVLVYLNSLGSNLPLPAVPKEEPKPAADAASAGDAASGDAASATDTAAGDAKPAEAAPAAADAAAPAETAAPAADAPAAGDAAKPAEAAKPADAAKPAEDAKPAEGASEAQ